MYPILLWGVRVCGSSVVGASLQNLGKFVYLTLPVSLDDTL